MIEEVGDNLAQRGLARLDTWAASLTSKGRLHASGVVRRKWFFINRFKEGYR